MPVTGLDFFVLAILALSILLGLVRGGVKEILSLAAWIVAFLVARLFADTASGWLPTALVNPLLRHWAGFILVFVIVIVIAMLLSSLVSLSFKAIGLGMFDRLLGGIFGALRGVVIVLILVLLAGLTALPKTMFWRHSLFVPYLVRVAGMVQPWLPGRLSSLLHYGPPIVDGTMAAPAPCAVPHSGLACATSQARQSSGDLVKHTQF